jgi:nucleoside-diphosphate-sugar epimerase
MSQPAETMTVIVTGSSSLIGSALVEHLAHFFQVFALDRKEPARSLPRGTHYINADLTSDRSVAAALEQVQDKRRGAIASVVHLVAYYDFLGEPSSRYEELAVQATQRLLRRLRDSQVEQFIFGSTMLVHKPTDPGKAIREDDPVEGKWDYPKASIKGEEAVREERGSTSAAILRVAEIYTDVCDSIPLSQQIRRIYERQATAKVFPGDTSHGQAFVHLDDLMDAITRTIENHKDLPEEVAILIGEPETYSYNTLQKRLAQLIHDEPDWETRSISRETARADFWPQAEAPDKGKPFTRPWILDIADDHYELDTRRAREFLDWGPEHRLINTLPKMVAALKADPEGWYKRHKLAI